MIVRPGPRCVEIDGEGGGVPMAEIRRVAALFHAMFGVEPSLRISGRFGAGALGAEPETPEMAAWWVRPDAAWCPVVRVGDEWLYVQPFYGSTRAPMLVSPFRGTMVRIRLFIH